MLLEQKDVNPNPADAKSGLTPLLLAVGRRMRVVNMLLERKDVRTTRLDNNGRTPLYLALSGGHNGIAQARLEWGNVNSDTADRGGQTPPPPSTRNGDWFVAKMQFPDNGSNSRALDHHDLPPPPSTHQNGHEVVFDSKHSVFTSNDSDFLTEPPGPPQPPFPNLLESQFSSRNTSTHPSTTQAILPFAVDRLSIISYPLFLPFPLSLLHSLFFFTRSILIL